MDGYRILTVSLLNKKKYKITLEGAEMITLSLYPSEIRRYDIRENNLISEERYQEIREILYKRGKERALYYLKTSDKTTLQMQKKLREGYYPEDIVEQIIEFLKKYGYIDDLRYSRQYISYNVKRKSYQRIRNDLQLKGVGRENIEQAFNELSEECECEENPQIDIIRQFVKKKLKDNMEYNDENKIVKSLVRKGFQLDDVISVIREEKNTRFSG